MERRDVSPVSTPRQSASGPHCRRVASLTCLGMHSLVATDYERRCRWLLTLPRCRRCAIAGTVAGATAAAIAESIAARAAVERGVLWRRAFLFACHGSPFTLRGFATRRLSAGPKIPGVLALVPVRGSCCHGCRSLSHTSATLLAFSVFRSDIVQEFQSEAHTGSRGDACDAPSCICPSTEL
ncbi:hypothetical protein DE146DRAFT_106598 [Phaeosphaeria sp. MPI-PUGE-AT-0046c]|nr:hypothetical protein DE146DRAFT_106598 [Phaeosphaeria sp. MPI-PUGE-AT-0046c]